VSRIWVKLDATTPIPLSELSPEKRRAIEEAVARPDPPPRFLRLPFAEIPSRAWYEWHWARNINPDRKRKLSEKTRDLVITRDGLTCRLCGGPVERSDVHVDHIRPRAKGGDDSLSNLQVSHSACNVRKGANG